MGMLRFEIDIATIRIIKNNNRDIYLTSNSHTIHMHSKSLMVSILISESKFPMLFALLPNNHKNNVISEYYFFKGSFLL